MLGGFHLDTRPVHSRCGSLDGGWGTTTAQLQSAKLGGVIIALPKSSTVAGTRGANMFRGTSNLLSGRSLRLAKCRTVERPTSKERRALAELRLQRMAGRSANPTLARQLRTYPRLFGVRLLKSLTKLRAYGQGQPPLPPGELGPEVFGNLEWSDWPEADLASACMYLRGNKSLAAPEAWKAHFPDLRRGQF